MRVQKRVQELDVVRAISLIMIIIYHFNIQLGFHDIGDQKNVFVQKFPTENIGSLGVTLFIIVSGASLMYNYCDNFNVKQFYLKRVQSIFPIYYLAYFFTFMLLFYVYGLIPVSNLKTFPLTLIAMDGFLYELIPNTYLCGEWFVGFIIIFYILFPLLRKLILCHSRRIKLCFCAVMAAAYILLTINNFMYKILPFDMTRNPLLRMPEFLFGMWWGKRKYDSTGSKSAEEPPKMNCQYVLYIIVLLAVFITAVSVNFKMPHNWVALISGIMLFELISCVCYLLSRYERVFILPEKISRYSFAAILVHHNIIALVIDKFNGNHGISWGGLYTLFMCCATVTAFASVGLYNAAKFVGRIYNDGIKK